jgi:major membrane immunogen (membrane-anchored lipoprotein)
MKRSIVLCAAVLLAACGADDGSPPPSDETATTPPADSTGLEGTSRLGAPQAVQQRADKAEADMAERAREAEEQVRAAEGGTAQP